MLHIHNALGQGVANDFETSFKVFRIGQSRSFYNPFVDHQLFLIRSMLLISNHKCLLVRGNNLELNFYGNFKVYK